jgi:hypothetical protein
VAYNGPVMGFVGSGIEPCGSVVINNGAKNKIFLLLFVIYQMHLCTEPIQLTVC